MAGSQKSAEFYWLLEAILNILRFLMKPYEIEGIGSLATMEQHFSVK